MKQCLLVEKGHRRGAFRAFLATAFTLVLLLSGSLASAQQPASINLRMRNTNLKQVVWEIEKQSGITFIYNSSDIEKVKIAALQIENKGVEEALAQSMKGTGFTYENRDGVYVLQKEGTVTTTAAVAKVTGKVSGGDGPLVGVSVVVDGTTIGTTTNEKGIYTLEVPQPATSSLTFYFVGMKPMTVHVLSRTKIDVTLEEEAQKIEQVIVTGYGNKSADSYTGAAHIITADQINLRAIGTIEEALRGLSPGTITAGSGQPGQELEVRLRGIGSLNTNNQPLYVVDGVVWDQVNMSGNSSSTTNPLNALNPADIANITELKDAASASLYGSRGANGVIVITTKQGMETDKPRFNLNLQCGFAHMQGHPDLTNGPEYAEVWSEGQMHYLVQQQLAREGRKDRSELVNVLKALYGDKDGYTYAGYNYNQWMKMAHGDFNNLYRMPNPKGGYYDYDYFGLDRDKLPSTDWFKEISRLAPFYRANLSMQGGGKTMKYYNSLEYFDQQGTITSSYLKRYAMRFKLSSDSDRQLITYGLNTYLAHTVQSGPQAGGQTYNSPQYAAMLLPSVIPAYLDDGSYNFHFPNNLLNSTHNPVASARENMNEKPLTNINVMGWVQIRLTPWLKFKSTGSLYYLGIRREAYYDNTFGTGLSYNGQLYERDVHRRKFTNQNLLTVDKTWRGRHRLNVVAGVELEDLRYRFNQMIITNFASNDKPAASMGSTMSGWDGGGYDHSLFSVISSVDYSYRYRYFISGSYRIDKSSRFSPENRLGHFWSVSGAYKISNEPFFKPLRKIFTSLRIKGSYGINGNLPDSYYLWRDGYSGNTYAGANGATQTYRPNANLTWEGNRIWNVGVDMRLFDNRVQLDVQYYNRRSDHMIQDVPVPEEAGYEFFTMNTDAGIENRGMELDISASPLRSKDWRLDLNFNIATLKSTYYGLGYQKLDSYSRQIVMDGVSVYSWYLREYAGIDPETGSALYVCTDADGNKFIDPDYNKGAQYSIHGQGLPKVTGGFRATVGYRNWELSILTSFAAGHYIYDRMGGACTATNGATTYSIARTQLNRWTPDNTSANNPLRVNNTGSVSRHTGYLIKGDYIKLKSIKLQYNLPQSFLKSLRITRASVFVQTENPFIISRIKDYDPEMSLTGYRYTDLYPTAGTYTAGIAVSF